MFTGNVHTERFSYGDNVNCLQLVLSLRLYAFALVLSGAVVWFRGRFESQHQYKRPNEIQSRPYSMYICTWMPASVTHLTLTPLPSSHTRNTKFPFVILNCTKRIVNKFIEREFCSLVSNFCPFFHNDCIWAFIVFVQGKKQPVEKLKTKWKWRRNDFFIHMISTQLWYMPLVWFLLRNLYLSNIHCRSRFLDSLIRKDKTMRRIHIMLNN